MTLFFFFFFFVSKLKKKKRRDALAFSVRESVVGQAGYILTNTNIKKSEIFCRKLGNEENKTNGNGEWKRMCASAWKGRNRDQERRICDQDNSASSNCDKGKKGKETETKTLKTV